MAISGAPIRLRPHGDLDLLTVEALRRDLATAVDAGDRDVVVDLSEVDHVDIVALSAILAAADAAHDRGRELHIAAARLDLRRVCALLRAEDILLADADEG